MSKKIVITEDEKNRIKSLYNINEQGIGAGAIIPALFSSIFSTTGKEIDDELLNYDTTTEDDDFYKSVLKCLGAKPTRGNMLFMYAWRQAEGGSAKNNPFNTTLKYPGATNYNSVGVKNYKTAKDGVEATCKTLKNGRETYKYDKIIDGLKNDIGVSKLVDAVVNSGWGTKEILRKVYQGYVDGSSPKPQPIA